MNYKIFVVFCFFIGILSCQKNQSQNEEYLNIKRLEYMRSGNIEEWQSLYDNSSNQVKSDILVAVSKTKNDSLTAFIDRILKKEASSLIKANAFLALGQLGSNKAEDILTQYFYEVKNKQLKRSIILALQQCATDKSIPILLESLGDDSLRSQALETAAILARKKVDTNTIKNIVSDSLWEYGNLRESAYYLYYNPQKTDVEPFINYLETTTGLTQKYYLRAISKLLEKNNNVLRSDSTITKNAHANLSAILNSDETWQNKYYALKNLSAVADSSDIPLLKRFANSTVINLKLEALTVISKIEKNESLSYLLNKLQNENDYTVKGKIVYLIAQISSKSAYRLIMQDLDKGPVSYKQDLLKALALFNDKISMGSLKNYLNVKEKRLVNTAFYLLNEKRRITPDDINILMSTDHFSVLYYVLDWQKEKKKYAETSLLISAFKKFSKEEHEGAQIIIVDLLISKKSKLTIEEKETLYKNAASKSVFDQLQQSFSNENFIFTQGKKTLPGFLQADSLILLNDSIIKMELSTDKGLIFLELFPDIAPMTVLNFIQLVKKGFYNNLLFHRVIPDFVVQGGDPGGDGWGGAGYTIPSEDYLAFNRGTLGIATSGFDTGSCQFFICQSEQPHLRGNYTAFGQVTSGMDIVDNIQIDDKIKYIKLIK